jgi:hypothetical protein
MRRRCERAGADGRAVGFGEYFVTSGREPLGTVTLVGGRYRATASDGSDCGEHALLTAAIGALPEPERAA